MASSLVKPYLKKFVLRTHPDFFGHDLSRKRCNEDSLQQLYTLLGPLLKKSPPMVKEKTRLAFYDKSSQKQVEGTFDQPTSEWATLQSFLSLCKELGIPIKSSDMDTVRSMVSQSSGTRAARMHKSLKQEFAEALYKGHDTSFRREWTPKTVLENRLLMMGPSVDKNKMAERLCEILPQLKPEIWWGKIPVLIVSPESSLPVTLTKGMLILTSDMQCADIEQYLAANFERKHAEHIEKYR
ncbi:hypothetical protein J3Q64DRAFT_1138542 [Phycomyces blakesleeanus]|uniref:DUF4460 domain-containing protein n=2 Tax=Phycomyces blakesleeanus TaxID=4837 RepID=A0A162XBQ1_PHYB8|nr:hypothetical protein PHYBLDRAFT_168199 [Phycomyces blakesleeanus NRRL 1555(-)]OAD73765.1 hypothetical protein PHYBLDRAFT_168199 [Phycomyces blakesleeanus NRRL 1555(-)]|eukprot:XP_018291805.1 hypothetical protein PHYBLDRAFT_168199 [Phycomyces blakesleeanus NRRL 1555(-)]